MLLEVQQVGSRWKLVYARNRGMLRYIAERARSAAKRKDWRVHQLYCRMHDDVALGRKCN